MDELKKYSFEITTLKNMRDKDSPYTLIKFEFLSSSLKNAENYRKSLIEHYNSFKPYIPEWPYEKTELIEVDF